MASNIKVTLHTVYLSLGSNTGDRGLHLTLALDRIELLGMNLKLSPMVESDSWGYDDDNKYLNLVCKLQTLLSPGDLLKEIQRIELDLGRVRTKPIFEARTIDIDILFYDDFIIHSEGLVIPHPRLEHRNFVLIPLAILEPGMMHPVLLKTILELKDDCRDQTFTEIVGYGL